MIPSKVVTHSPRKVTSVGSGISVAQNSYDGKYVFFQSEKKQNAYVVKINEAKASRSSKK